MDDRRKRSDRRDTTTRGEERRMGDRRDSHRLPMDVEVREGNASFEKHQGNIAIGGMFFAQPLMLPTGSVVQLRFTLPGTEQELLVKGEVVEITSVGAPEETGTRVRFNDLDLKTELHIAKFLDENTDDSGSRST